MADYPSYCEEKATELIDSCVQAATDSTSSIESLTEQQAIIDDQINTISSCINPNIASEFESYVLGTLYPISTYIMTKRLDTYNNTSILEGNLTDWNILQVSYDNSNSDPLKHWIRLTSGSFKVVGDHRNLFTQNPNLLVYNFAAALLDSTGFTNIIYDHISNDMVTYDETTGCTIVELRNGGLTEAHIVLLTYKASYNNPTNSTITQYINDWNVGHDMIHKSIDQNSSYGLNAKKTMLENAKTMMSTNATKFKEAATSWTKYLKF